MRGGLIALVACLALFGFGFTLSPGHNAQTAAETFYDLPVIQPAACTPAACAPEVAQCDQGGCCAAAKAVVQKSVVRRTRTAQITTERRTATARPVARAGVRGPVRSVVCAACGITRAATRVSTAPARAVRLCRRR